MKKPIRYLLATSITLGAALGLAVADDEAKKSKKDKKAKAPTEDATAAKADSDKKADAETPRGQRPGGPPQRGQAGKGGKGGKGGPGGGRPPGGGAPPSFAEMDTDNDGAVSKKEFVAMQVKRAKERATEGFAFIDSDESGSLSEQELQAFGQRMRERMRGGPGQGGRRPDGAPGATRGQGPRPGASDGDRPQRPQRPKPDGE